ncbi:MAG: F0F1 ATP synthase subunit epsilon [Alphaproteobacteria bacterium]
MAKMTVDIVTPEEIILQTEATKVAAEGEHGFFALLPKHIDFAVTLPPSLLTITDEDKVRFFAYDQGVLTKIGKHVRISCFRVIEGKDLPSLAEVVKEEFFDIQEEEKKARTSLARLEGTVAKLIRNLKG